MRLLTLCSLAVPGTSVSYDTIISGLKIEKNEVEKWIIEGVAHNVVNVKIDQQKRQVNVTKTIQREVTKEKWEEIEKKLSQWKNSVETVLKQLQEKKNDKKEEKKTE
jgi:translation initiation factor 3 subunit M